MKDLKAIIRNNSSAQPSEVELFNFSFGENTPVDVLIRMARENIHKLSSPAVESFGSRVTFFSIRESITKLMLILRCNYQDLKYGDFQFFFCNSQYISLLLVSIS